MREFIRQINQLDGNREFWAFLALIAVGYVVVPIVLWGVVF